VLTPPSALAISVALTTPSALVALAISVVLAIYGQT
jgi:hypothetical protein